MRSTGHAHIFEGTSGNVSLKLQRSDASGAVDFGDIQFVNNTGIAAKINSRGEGSASGNLTFETRNTGGSLAERMRITSTGEIVTGGLTSSTGQLHLYKADATGGKLVLQSQVASDATAKITMMSRLLDNTNKNAYIEAYRGNINFGGDSGYGNVGIGTSSPDVNLDIKYAGDDPVGTSTRAGAFSIKGGHTSLDMGANDNSPYNSWIQTRHNNINTYPTAYYNLAINPLGGNVGIGTNSPEGRLHVEILGSNATPPIKINRGRDGGRIQLQYNSNETGYGEIGQMYAGSGRTQVWIGANLNSFSTGHNSSPLQHDANYASWFSDWDSYRDRFTIGRIASGTTSRLMIIDSSGNVGIGNSDPSSKLEVGNGSSTYVKIRNAASGDVASGYNIMSGSTTTTSLYGNAGEGWTTLLSGGDLNFRVNNAVSGFNPMSIKTSGAVSTPNQPGFFARGNTTQWLNLASGWSILRGGTIGHASGGYIGVNLTDSGAHGTLNSYDIGSDFNTANGRFTAPVEGKYHIHGSIYAQKYSSNATASDYIHFLVSVNGQQINEIYTIGGYGQPSNYEFSNNISTIILLEENDYVEWRVYATNSYMRLYGDHISIGAHMIS